MYEKNESRKVYSHAIEKKMRITPHPEAYGMSGQPRIPNWVRQINFPQNLTVVHVTTSSEVLSHAQKGIERER